jgi:dihydrofolate synthase / folylpolyglutamate synthase
MSGPPRRSPAAAYLASRTRFGIKFGLETMQALMEALRQPQVAFPTLLVAGTNGKGSVAAYADAALRAAGLRCGRYTSPHLVRVNERIAVGGGEIAPDALEAAVDQVRHAARRLVRAGTLSAHPTFFEVVTAAAFVHFRDQAVDVAVLEVGMGGRLDATNVSAPVASAIVTVDKDHEQYLGSTLGAIAAEKAGVLRPGRVTVLGRMAVEASIAVLREADRIGARCVDAFEGTTAEPSSAGLRVRTTRDEYVVATLPGRHQQDNAVVALRLLEEATAAGLRFDLARAARGFAGARWPGRLQRVPGRPALLLDGAHNASGAAALAAALRSEPPFVLVFGAMADKDVAAVGRELFPLARAVVVTQAPGERAAAPTDIVARVGPVGPPVRREPGVGRALGVAERLAGPDGLVVVAGSLYLVGDVLRRMERGPVFTRRPAAAKAEGPRPASDARRASSPPARERPRPPARTHRGDRTRARAASPTRPASRGRRDRGKR